MAATVPVIAAVIFVFGVNASPAFAEYVKSVPGLKVAADWADSLLKKGMEQNRSGEWEKAIANAQAVIDSSDTDIAKKGEALYQLAYAHIQLGNLEQARKAIEEFEKIRSSMPKNSWVPIEMDKLKPELSPESPEYKLRKAMELNRSGKWTEANAMAREVLTMKNLDTSKMAEAYYQLAYSYIRLGNKEEARRVIEQFDDIRAKIPSSSWMTTETNKLESELMNTQ